VASVHSRAPPRQLAVAAKDNVQTKKKKDNVQTFALLFMDVLRAESSELD